MVALSRKMNFFKPFLKCLYGNEYIQEALYAKFLSASLDQEDMPNRELKHDEVMQLVNYYQNHVPNYALLSLLATTGLLILEVVSTQQKEVGYDYQSKRYHIEVRTKGNRLRDTLITPRISNRIVVYRQRKRLSADLGDENEG